MTSDPCESTVMPGTAEGSEADIAAVIELFYSFVHADPLLGPLFSSHVHHWEQHLQAMRDFWSTALLGANRYKGNAFAAHMRLPVEEAHFTRFLLLWEQAASQALPPVLAQRAIKRARHMSQSFRTGLLPYKRADGSLARESE